MLADPTSEAGPSEDDVVDQLRFAHADGADGSVAVTNGVHALECVSVDDSEITRGQSDYTLQHSPPRRLQCAGAPLTTYERVSHGEERLRENQSELALLCGQVAVAARHRPTVWIPHHRRDEHSHRIIEIANHRLDRSHLPQVFLSE